MRRRPERAEGRSAPRAPRRLDVPADVGAMVDAYAAELSREWLIPVTRQQAFERLVRFFLGQQSRG